MSADNDHATRIPAGQPSENVHDVHDRLLRMSRYFHHGRIILDADAASAAATDLGHPAKKKSPRRADATRFAQRVSHCVTGSKIHEQRVGIADSRGRDFREERLDGRISPQAHRHVDRLAQRCCVCSLMRCAANTACRRTSDADERDETDRGAAGETGISHSADWINPLGEPRNIRPRQQT